MPNPTIDTSSVSNKNSDDKRQEIQVMMWIISKFKAYFNSILILGFVIQGCMDAEEYEARCPNWARNGECKKNPKFMRVYCAKSCKECAGMFLSLLTLLGSSST